MNWAHDSKHNSECLFTVYTDLTQAFDTVNHRIMLKKFQPIRVSGGVYCWFKTCLNDCKEYIAVDGLFPTTRVID